MNREPYALPFQIGNNPWTLGLQFFTILDSAYTPLNFVLPGGGTASQPASQEIVTGTEGYPGLNFNGANSEYIEWDRTAIGSLTGTGITVIARVKPTSGSGKVGSIFGTYQVAAVNGFMLYFNDAGGADQGISFIVGEAGGLLYSASGSSGSYSGYEYTAGGRYDDFTRTTSVWQNGVQLDSDTDAGTAWLTTATSFLHSGRIPNSAADFYDGDIFWIAVFNRRLTDAEMVVWTTSDPLDLILPPAPALQASGDLPYALTNEITVADQFSGRSPFVLGVELTVGAILSGDLASVPPVPPTFALANVVLVNSDNSLITAPGNLIVLQNVVTVTNAMATFTTFSLANEVLVGGSFQTTVGNQIAGGRYRR